MAIVLAFVLILSLMIGYTPTTSVAQDNETTIEYLFRDVVSGQDDWRLVGDPTEPPTVTQQNYGVSVYATGIGQSRDFEFDVPEAGYYLVSLQGYLYHSAAIADIRIDGESIGQYDFYDPGSQYGPELPLKTIALTKGTHILTLLAEDRNSNADQGRNYSMYPTQLTLTAKSELPSLQFTARAIKSRLVIEEKTRIATSVTMSDGTSVSASNVMFSSDDQEVVTVDEYGVVTAHAKGKAHITATIQHDDLFAEETMEITVTDATLASVDLSIDKEEVPYGRTAQLTVAGTLSDGMEADLTGATITYSSDTPSIAKVNAHGEVTGRQPGMAMIEAIVSFVGVVETASLTVNVADITNSKTRSTIYTEEKIANARDNVEKFGWARSLRDAAVQKADTYLAEGYDYLWHLVPPQTLPRSTSVNHDLGSPITGKEIDKYGSHPWLGDPLNEPWKIEDPTSGYKFPTNDFKSYYESGLDENGIFDSDLADDQYLVNELYPEKGEKWGVDDGFGWVDDDGNRWTFVAHYVHWFLWYGKGKGLIEDAVGAFRDAYVFTGDIEYARAGAILLDRIADVYPSLDISVYDRDVFTQSDFGSNQGKAIGSIWEVFIVKDFMSAYDAFFPVLDDPVIVDFLSDKAEQYHLDNLKNSGTAIRRNIEDGIIREVYPAVRTVKIHGNSGMHQSALAMAAVVLDTLPETKEWLDFNFQAGIRSVQDGLWVEFDVTKQLQMNLIRDQRFSVKVFDPSPGTDGTSYHSSKSSSGHPELVITTSDGEITLNPEADAYVRDGRYADDNYGSSGILYIRNAPGSHYTREAYLRFDVSEIRGVIQQAKVRLRLRGETTRGGLTNKAEWVEDNDWDAHTITWNNRPEGSGKELAEWTLPTSSSWSLTGGDILPSLVNLVDRDGHGNEASPQYNRLWLEQYLEAADILEGYDLYPTADLYENVKFRKMFSAMYPLLLSDKYTPSIGDHGKVGAPDILVNKDRMVKAFEKFGEPIFAQLAYFRNNNSVEGIHGDVFAANPAGVAEAIQEVINEHGPLDLRSTNLAGYGFTALRDGASPVKSYGLPYKFPLLDVVAQNTDHKIFEDSGTVQLEANQVGAKISFAFDVPKTDEYEITLMPFRASSYGIYQISIDGQLVKELDFYGSLKEHETIAHMALTEGTHEIAFEGVGKNDKASNYKMGVTELVLLDEDARQQRDDLLASKNTMRDLWMYYGRTIKHGHRDTLNLGLHAFGLDLAPDLGYPEYANNTDTHRHQWVNNTISHNTVVVDQSKQRNQWVGDPKHFDDSEIVKLMDVEAPKVYPQTELYKRTTAMIKVDEENSYAIDFFRVKGGDDHHFSFHGAEGTVSTEGLALVEQPTGTYTGPDVAFGERVDSVDGEKYMGSGFHYLKNVERDANPDDIFSVDWDIVDTWNVLEEDEDIHLRLTMLGEIDEVALADGVPPRNKPGNPETLRYFIAHRSGDNLDSVFTSVIEPYKDNRYIASIEPATVRADGEEVPHIDARAVKVTLTNGRVDYIVNSMNPDVLYTVDDTFTFKGFFGVYAEKDGEPVYGYLNDGTVLGDIVQAEANALTGTVVDFTKELSVDNQVTVELDAPYERIENLIGSHLYIENDGERNGSYRIEGIKERAGTQVTFDIGDITFIRNYADAEDLSKGFVYNIAEGAAVALPLAVERQLETEEVTVETLQQLVEHLADEGEFENDPAVHALRIHLMAVGRFEKQEDAAKIIKHMQGFNVLLDHQHGNKLISDEAYHALKADTEALIRQWQ